MAPAVFVLKKSGELRNCVDYRSLNKQSAKESYPLPLYDNLQDCLANASGVCKIVVDIFDTFYNNELPSRSFTEQVVNKCVSHHFS